MTLSVNLIDVGGVEFAVAEVTDTVNVNGFTDTLSLVGATSAKFSGGADMIPNVGLRIGIKQTIIESNLNDLRGRSVIQNTVSSPGNAIDNNLNTETGSTNDATPEVGITIDFGSSATALISAKIRVNGPLLTVLLQISTDNIIWVTVATSLNTAGIQTLLGGSQTYRYARINVTVNPDGGVLIFEIYEASFTGNTTVNIRESNNIDIPDGVILDTRVITIGTTITLDSELFLINSGKFYTLEIVSFSAEALPVKLTGITSIKEEP